MPNPEYMLAREMALRANEIGPSSCVGNGACCESTTPLVIGDAGLIIRDIRSGKISSETINETISRSQDPKRQTLCPFLNTENRCSIYESRPLTCVVWGIGGLPLDGEDYARAIRGWERSGIPDTYPNIDLNQLTCLKCRLSTASNSTKIEANELALKASRFAEIRTERRRGGQYTVSQFVKAELNS